MYVQVTMIDTDTRFLGVRDDDGSILGVSMLQPGKSP